MDVVKEFIEGLPMLDKIGHGSWEEAFNGILLGLMVLVALLMSLFGLGVSLALIGSQL